MLDNLLVVRVGSIAFIPRNALMHFLVFLCVLNRITCCSIESSSHFTCDFDLDFTIIGSDVFQCYFLKIVNCLA